MKNWKQWMLAGLLSVLGIFVLTGCGKKKINLNDYLEYTISGFDGYGSISADYDIQKLIDDVGKASGIKVDVAREEIFSEDSDKLSKISNILLNGISYQWSKTDQLANGDTLTLHWDNSDEKLMELNRVDFEYSDMDVNVSDLEPVGEFDPFQNIEITVDGYDSLGKIVDIKSSDYDVLSFKADQTSQLSNGDVVTITMNDASDSQLLGLYGALPSTTSMEYTVSGLEPVGEFDPFQNIEITVDGYDSLGKIVDIKSSDYDVLSFKADQTSQLSNGDVVTITMNDASDSQLIGLYGALPSTTTMEYTVSGLEELEQYDPFENLKITPSGMSPDGTLLVENPDYDSLYYYVENNGCLSNDDTVKISIDSIDLESMVYQYGMMPSRTEMEYTVEGLGEYVRRFEDIPEDIKVPILMQVDDFASNMYNNDKWNTLLDGRILGFYFLTPKSPDSEIHNQLYVVYKQNIHNVYHDEKEARWNFVFGGKQVDYPEDLTVYKYVKFTDLIKNDDGTGYVDVLNYSYPRSNSAESFTASNRSTIVGYENLLTLENQCISSQKLNWNVEKNFGDMEELATWYPQTEENTDTRYIQSLDEIPEDLDTAMKQELQNLVNSIVDSYNTNTILTQYELVGEYLFTPDNEIGFMGPVENRLYIVCKPTVSTFISNSSTRESTYIWICFKDLVKFDDGSAYTDLTDYSYSGVHYISELDLNYYGYGSMQELEAATFVPLEEEWKKESRQEGQSVGDDTLNVGDEEAAAGDGSAPEAAEEEAAAKAEDAAVEEETTEDVW